MATLGYTSIGATENNGLITGVPTYLKFTAGASFSATKMFAYMSGQGSTPPVTMGIYADAAGSIGSLLGTTEEVAIGAAAGWVEADLVAPVAITSGQSYWLCQSHGSSTISLFRDAAPGNVAKYSTDAYSAGTVPASPTSPFAWDADVAYSMYADEGIVADAIVCNDQSNGRVFQRTKGTTAKTITFSGTYAGTAPATVEVKIVQHGGSTQVQDYTALSGATIGGGTWTGTLSVPQGTGSVWYNFLARGKDGGGSVLATSSQTSNKWGVGILIAMIGQSNMVRMFTTSSGPPASHDLTRKYNGSWGVVTGNGAIEFANRVRAGTDLPVGLLQYAVDATSLHTGAPAGYWINTAGGSPSALFEAGATAVGGDYEFIVWHQGESDADPSIQTTKSQYKTDLDSLYLRYRTSTGRSTSQLKFGIALIAAIDNGSQTDADTDAIRQAQLEWSGETTGAFFAGSSVDSELADGVHYTAAAYLRLGKRYAQAVLYQLGAVAFGANGPRITSASRTLGSDVMVVRVAQGSGTALEEVDGSGDGGSVTGFEVSDDDFATNLTISSTAFSGNTLRLTLSAAPANSDVVKVRYQYGAVPTITNPVYDDSVPQSDSIGLPLQPSHGAVSVAVPSGRTGMNHRTLRPY